jgi:carbonic anhydrase
MASTVQFLRSPVTRGVIPSLGTAKPQILWIGCSSSGIAETETLGVLPEEIIEHRNIGNLLSNDDLSTQSSVEYALRILKVCSMEQAMMRSLLTDRLKVKHIVICGHYGCKFTKIDSHDHPESSWLRLALRRKRGKNARR